MIGHKKVLTACFAALLGLGSLRAAPPETMRRWS